MSRGRIVVIFGTRPEAIKLGPVVAELRALGVHPTLLNTGQHTDLLTGTPADSDLAGAGLLRLASTGDIHAWETTAIPTLDAALHALAPVACVVVQGDTMTAKCGAIAAKARGMRVAHVEAGLRSHRLDEPWPEEENRVVIGMLADDHFAPTATARQNLLAEGVEPTHIWRTGNPGISAMHRYGNIPPSLPLTDNGIITITLHRREWLTGPGAVHDALVALRQSAAEYPHIWFDWPVHPHVYHQLLPEQWHGDESHQPNLTICQPWPYPVMAGALPYSLGLITDSGGLQEEAAYLGVPCAVMRHVTDRPESINAGTAALFPPNPDGIRRATHCLVHRNLPRTPLSTFGDSQSAFRIAARLARLV